MRRWSKLVTVQRDATQSSLFIILQVQSACFGCQPHPSSRLHKTVTTTSVTGPWYCIYLPPTWPTLGMLEGGSCTKIWPVPEAVVTVLFTPDGGFGWHPKHVEWTCRIINRLILLHLVEQLLIYLGDIQNLYLTCDKNHIYIYVYNIYILFVESWSVERSGEKCYFSC